jgi:proliferating cell nuclear antigen
MASQMDIDSRYSLQIKSVQGSCLKSLFEVLKELLSDCNILVTKEGLKIIALDSSQVTLVHVFLEAEKFEVFHCTENAALGLNIQNMYKLLKTTGTQDTLTMQIDRDSENELEIIIQNTERKTKTFFKLRLLDIDDERLSIPDVQLKTCITLNGVDFQRLIRDMNQIGQAMRIHIKDSMVAFETRGDFASQRTELDTETGADEDEIDLTFSLKLLALFSKASSLSQTCNLWMQPNFPLVAEYSEGSIGSIRMVLAACCNSDI